MARALDDIDFEKLVSIGTSVVTVAQEDRQRKKVTFQNTGTTTITIGKSRTGKPLVSLGEGWILEPASSIDKGDGGTLELESRAKISAISSASGGQMVRILES